MSTTAAKNAILSVSDPTAIETLGRSLSEMGFSIYATSGTKKKLEAAGVPARSVSDLTGFPEILGGRVKTLHPGVLSGVLARRDDPAHMEELRRHNLQTVDLVAVNLYPFAQTIAREDITLPEALEQIDVGGPTMVRSAAKNHASVIVLTDPADYNSVLDEWRTSGEVSAASRLKLAAKAFRHVSEYDALIAGYLERERGDASTDDSPSAEEKTLPGIITLSLRRAQPLRYGENPHQSAALYSDDLRTVGTTLVGSLRQLRAPELSYNNLLDADAALTVARDYRTPAVAIIKHAGPCGIACAAGEDDLPHAFERALASDPVSAFGGIVGVNRVVEAPLARLISKTRFDLLVASGFTDDALEILSKKKHLRLLAVSDADQEHRDADMQAGLAFRQISGGFLVQVPDAVLDQPHMEPATLRHPTLEEIADLNFAWRAVRHVRSNAIVLARRQATVGIGGGQPSRVDSVKIAVEKAGESARGAVLASDAFFPFPDGLEAAAAAGVTAVIQPGGSVNDDAVIEAADVAGMAMVFTGRRHFKH